MFERQAAVPQSVVDFNTRLQFNRVGEPHSAHDDAMRNTSIRTTIQPSLGVTPSGMATNAESKGLCMYSKATLTRKIFATPPPNLRPRNNYHRRPVAGSGYGAHGSSAHVCFYQCVVLDDVLD